VSTLSERERARLRVVLLERNHVDRRWAATVAGVSMDTARRWNARQTDELEILDASRSGRPARYGKAFRLRFIGFYCQSTPLPDCGRWTLRWAEEQLRRDYERIGGAPSRSTMQRILAGHDLRPHRNRYFLQITDPDFFAKMDHIIALYGSDLKNLFCFDECPGIQILQRIAPALRPSNEEGRRLWWEEFEYIRNGTTDLFAFLNVRSGRMQATFHPNHKKEVFVQQWREHVGGVSSQERIDYIMDNLHAHCCYEFCEAVAELSGIDCPSQDTLKDPQTRRDWLQGEDKRIVIHFTPFHGSWLNMAEICFRIIGEKCLKDSYSSPHRLHAAVESFIDVWNKDWAHPFTWRYDGAGLRGKAVVRFTAALEHSAAPVSLQYLTKSCRLMINLMAEDSPEAESTDWRKLAQTLGPQETRLREIITLSTQPIVKAKAEQALNDLLGALAQYEAREMTAA